MRNLTWSKIVGGAGWFGFGCLLCVAEQPIPPDKLSRIAFSHQPASSATSLAKSERNVDGIMDNSFLVEEAYNQEAGVVQHIFNGIYGLNRAPGSDDRTFDFVFTHRNLLHYHLGASAIYAPTRNLHFLLELIGSWNEGLNATGSLEREFESVISPGVRRAIDCANGTQIVLGVGAPIGLTSSAPDVGVFLYLSIEHGFLKNK